MSKLFIQNLGLITTEKCNLKCRHCMRGTCTNKDMSEDVVKKTLEQIDAIGNLTICGGEPTLAIPSLENILTYIVDNNITLGCATITINGTIYSEELLRLFDYLDEYLNPKTKETRTFIGISKDPFHIEEIIKKGLKEQYIENAKKYTESKHFYEYREITQKLFREGRAEELPEEITVPLKPWPIVVSYDKDSVCSIGPLICVNVDGIVTDCDASIEHQRTIYNYGSVFNESIEDICLKIGEVVPERKWYRKTGKIMKKQLTYKK